MRRWLTTSDITEMQIQNNKPFDTHQEEESKKKKKKKAGNNKGCQGCEKTGNFIHC